MSFFHLLESLFTCFLKDKTLHNHWDYAGFTVPYYNIPSNNRELQQCLQRCNRNVDYNIPSNNRELQRPYRVRDNVLNYNIPSNNRELQLREILSYRAKDYNIPSNNRELQRFVILVVVLQIITYQVITGNYSMTKLVGYKKIIITYQVITGNYS